MTHHHQSNSPRGSAAQRAWLGARERDRGLARLRAVTVSAAAASLIAAGAVAFSLPGATHHASSGSAANSTGQATSGSGTSAGAGTSGGTSSSGSSSNSSGSSSGSSSSSGLSSPSTVPASGSGGGQVTSGGS